jgi:N-acyl-D-amino-acid deacylase
MGPDILISGGKLIDGTGVPWRYADVGISGDRVAVIGRLGDSTALRRIDAAGHFVCPGFIDMHSHADLTLLAGRWVDLRLRQGITTEVVGQDGLSYAPASPAHLQEWRRYLVGLNGDFPEIRWDWGSVADLIARYHGRAANVVYLIPHGAVRVECMGWEDRPAAGDELRAMQALVRQGLEQGAAGLSTGLSYVPCTHATTDEMVALCRPVAEAGGFLSIHLRSYIADFIPALDEAIEIGRRSGVAVQVSHLRMCDPATWGMAEPVLERLERGRGQGVDVTFDIYPYTMGSAPLFAMLPSWAQHGGPDQILARLNDPGSRGRIVDEMHTWATDWPAFVLSNVRPTELGDWTGHSLTEAAASLEMDVLEFILRLLSAAELDATIVADGGNQADNDAMFSHPAAMVCSDGLMIGGRPHPRGYGAFPRVLAQYVRQKGVLRWEEAIQKMSGLPAARLGLEDRGILRPGAAGDVVVFSPEEIGDHATPGGGRLPPSGIKWVLVNGQVVVDNGEVVRSDQGRALCPLLERRVS